MFAQQQRTCGTMDYMKEKANRQDSLQNKIELLENIIQNYRPNNQRSNSIFTIPTVVHVVYSDAIQNISDAQILSQLNILNEDFRRRNVDAANTPADFTSIAADTEIEFCLATIDPTGLVTTGITRTPTTITFGINDDIKFTDKGGTDVWDTNKYLNIWVGAIEDGILGYAQFPGADAATDGVVIDYRAFGTMGTAITPFNLGRTTTHEVGHWLYLFHIWGDGGCGIDDAVADTPTAANPNYTNPSCTYPGPNSCVTTHNDHFDMFQNYMDYSADACMNLFTEGQKRRMRAMLGEGGPRHALLQSLTCATMPDIVSDTIPTAIIATVDKESQPIPTMGEWGLLIFALLVLNMGVILLYRLEMTRKI